MIYLIYGPTSSGKSLLALELAQKVNGALISADSRQIYKYMDIGTGQLTSDKSPFNHNFSITSPNLEEVRYDQSTDSDIYNPREKVSGIDIYLTKLINPNIIYSVSDFQRHSLSLIRYLLERNKTPIIVGGTGLYTDSLFSDHDYGNDIPVLDPKEITFITPDITRDQVYTNIEKRVEEMFRSGFVDEVEKLLSMGYRNCRSLSGAGYKQIINYLDNRGKNLRDNFPEYLQKPVPPNPPILDLETCIEKVKIAYRNYAKRQYTWFRKYAD